MIATVDAARLRAALKTTAVSGRPTLPALGGVYLAADGDTLTVDREDAVAVAKEWLAGWDCHPQYWARYDLWTLWARRPSWRKPAEVVEACQRAAPGHAHVPPRYSFDRLAR